MKPPKNLPTSSVAKRGTKKGVYTPKPKKKRSTGRYMQIMIRLSKEDFDRGLPYFGDKDSLKKYVIEAFHEKVNRAEANDKAARTKKLLTDENLLLSVLTHMKETGKLKSLLG
jgi:hypothetical protein